VLEEGRAAGGEKVDAAIPEEVTATDGEATAVACPEEARAAAEVVGAAKDMFLGF
jgi:hypothetical protein